MKLSSLDDINLIVLKSVVVVIACAFFNQFAIPPLVTCLFLSVGYLAYTAFKK